MLITHPRVKAKYHIEPVEGEGIYLLSENERHVLEGDGIAAVMPLLDGRRSWDEILSAAQAHVGREKAVLAAEVLMRHGHLEQADDTVPPELQIFWSELGRDAVSACRLVGQCNLQLLTLGNIDRAMWEQSIALFGFPHYRVTSPPGLTLVVADDYQTQPLADINKRALAHGTPWALVKPGGLRPFVGPFFSPGLTACWSCLESRLRHNREVESYLQRRRGRNEPFPTTRAQIPLAQMQVISLTLLQIARWLATGRNSTLESRIVTLNILSGEQEHHAVVRRPQCPECGDPMVARVGGRELHLTERTLTDRGENGFRVEAPDVTFARYAHHVSDLTGVVKHVVPSPWSGAGPLKVYVAGHNFALKNDGLYFLKDGLRAVSSGKGKTDSQARTSALCEALERYSGLWRGEEETRIASFEELGAEAVDPTSVTLFSIRQYAEREAWLARGERFQIVPLPFDPKAAISWSPVWSLTQQQRRWLPTSLLYFGFSDDALFFWADSNGNAAGSSVEDAILQGFLELVERDAVAIWWYNRLRRPQVDLNSLGDPFIDQLRQFYAAHNREFWVLDLTADLGIPVMAAICRRIGGSTEDIIIGFGAHLDGRVAIMRALTEMNQFMPAVLTLAPDGSTAYGFEDRATVSWWKTATLSTEHYLQPADTPALPLTALASASTANVLEQVEMCRQLVESQGLEMLILDQTRPDVGLPVVKVIVPGLRHFWARFAPGRLYDVPVKLGWLTAPVTEDALNPIPMFV